MGQMRKSIGRGEAIQGVLSGLEEDPDDPLVVLEDSIRERPFGWVITFATKSYLETHNPTSVPFGDLTWVVDRHDSAVHAAGPAQFIDTLEPGFLKRFLDAYQLECSIRHGRSFGRAVAVVQRCLVEAVARLPRNMAESELLLSWLAPAPISSLRNNSACSGAGRCSDPAIALTG